MPATKTSTAAHKGDSAAKRSKAIGSLKLYDSVAVRKLISQYNDAIQQSRRVGRPMSFRVEVNPATDEPSVSPIQEAPPSAASTFLVEDVGQPEQGLSAALDAARERGRLRAAEILSDEDMLNAESFAELLGTTRATVNAKRQRGHLLGLDGAKRGYRFPTWQLDGDGRPFEALPKLFENLGRSPWAVYRFLVSPHGELDGRTGLEALRRGGTEAALAAAESIARGDFR